MQFARLNSPFVLSACSQPEPVAPEPIFDKYGNAVAECRPEGQPVGANFPSYLPICAPECPPGQQSPTGAAPTVCVPMPTPGDNGDKPPTGGQPPPTGGQNPTGAP